MPKTTLSTELRIDTRNKYTHADCTLTVVVSGTELPSMSVIGDSLEKAQTAFADSIAESYREVPARV